MPGGMGGIDVTEVGWRMPKPMDDQMYRDALKVVAGYAHDKEDLLDLIEVLDIPMVWSPPVMADDEPEGLVDDTTVDCLPALLRFLSRGKH